MESFPKFSVERRWHQVFLDKSRGNLNRVTRVYKCAAIGLTQQDQLVYKALYQTARSRLYRHRCLQVGTKYSFESS